MDSALPAITPRLQELMRSLPNSPSARQRRDAPENREPVIPRAFFGAGVPRRFSEVGKPSRLARDTKGVPTARGWGGVANFFPGEGSMVCDFVAAARPRCLSILDCAACAPVPPSSRRPPDNDTSNPPACRRPLDSGAGVKCAGSGKNLTSSEFPKTPTKLLSFGG